jgi:hypothetical protein
MMAIAQVSSVSHITCNFLPTETINYYLENHRSLNCNSSYILINSMTNVMDFAKTNVFFTIFDKKKYSNYADLKKK